MRRPAYLIASLLLPVAVLPAPGGSARAQSVADEARSLVQARARSAAAQDQARALERAAAAATDAARKARAARGAVMKRIESAEADIGAARARVRIVEALRVRQRARLAAARAPLARLAGALQAMARRPPAFALVQPGSLTDAVHVRAVLATAVPAVQARTADLRAAVAEGNRLAAQARLAAGTLADGQRRLAEQRDRLAALEDRSRERGAMLAASARAELDRAAALGEEARDIVDRMQEMGEEAAVADRLAALPGPVPRPPIPGRPPTPPGPARPYRLPAQGRLTTGFGELAESGVRSRGLTLRSKAGAEVAAPLPGRVAFAAPFRSYGRIVILDHGSGWTTTLTGLAAVSVKPGGMVAAGDVLGRAPAERPQITVELRHALVPVDPAPLVGPG